MAHASPPKSIAELRRELERMEAHGRVAGSVLPFRVPELDVQPPNGGLALGHLHEVIEGGTAGEYAGIATLFIAGILARFPARLPSPAPGCIRTASSIARPARIATCCPPWEKDYAVRGSQAWLAK
jgi:hypothetical protein